MSATAVVPGSLERLASLARQVRPSAVLVVTGGKSFQQSGAAAGVQAALRGLPVSYFSGVKANPTLEQLEDAIDAARVADPGLIVAVGGGSVLDIAKMAKVFHANGRRPTDYFANPGFAKPGPPLVAIPTTSGSGSEATQFAVLYVKGAKTSIDHPFLLPEFVILDPDLTATLGPATTAATGLDALSQGIESYWSARATPGSRALAEQAIRLAWPNLATAVLEPTPEARKAMMQAAHLAGQAINLTRTTAPHALSYVMTTEFDVPHGHAVALTLGEFFPFNAEAKEVSPGLTRPLVQRSISDLVRMLGKRTPEAARDAWYDLMREVRLEPSLGKLGVVEADLGWLADSANPERLANHPCKMTKDDVVGILRARL